MIATGNHNNANSLRAHRPLGVVTAVNCNLAGTARGECVLGAAVIATPLGENYGMIATGNHNNANSLRRTALEGKLSKIFDF